MGPGFGGGGGSDDDGFGGGGGGGDAGADHSDSVSESPEDGRRAKQHQNSNITRSNPTLMPIMIPPTSSRRRPVCSVVNGTEDLFPMFKLFACALVGLVTVSVAHVAIGEVMNDGVASAPIACLTSGIDRSSDLSISFAEIRLR